MATRIQVRRATAAEWTSANPVLAVGELGLETDTRRIKAGDGTTAWNSLSVLLNGAYAPLADGRLRVNFVALSPDLTTMAAAGPDNSVRVWDVATELRAAPAKKAEPKR